MSTVVVVRKNGIAAIAADTLTTFGNIKESAEYIVNHEKIISYKAGFLGVSGSANLHIGVSSFLSKTRKVFDLTSVNSIYDFGLALHNELKEKHFLKGDDEESFETFHGDILLANSSGIFGLSSYRYVQEYSKFYANGSGGDFALGSLYSNYPNPELGAEQIAVKAVEAGCEFDDGSGKPIMSFSLKLKKQK
ncbi:MAG: hypothetical protein ACK5NT_14040 [Pyrinomonadaceae bacterium]